MMKKVGVTLLEAASKVAVLAWFGYMVATICFVAKWIVAFLYDED